MTLARWDPFENLMSLRQAMDRLFDEAWVRLDAGLRGTYPPMDLWEDENSYTCRFAIPGMHPEDIDISVSGNILTVRGEVKPDEAAEGQTSLMREFRYGPFERRIELPTAVEADQAESTYEHGLLTVHLPKAAAVRPQRIAVRSTRGEPVGASA